MSASWVACSVRSRAMTRRRLGRTAARNLAASPSLEAALQTLAHTPYGHDVLPTHTLAEAQHAVVATAVWNLRVLAGWAPRGGVATLRALLAAVELVNLGDHLDRLAGRAAPAPFRLGRMDTAWTRLSATGSIDEVREVLKSSPWGEPGSDLPREIVLAMRASLADRVISVAPVAATWAVSSTALLFARETLLGGHELPERAREMAVRVLGSAPLEARSLAELASALPRTVSWVLDGIASPDDLWQAEARWWQRVEHDAFPLVRRPVAGPEAMVGAAALLAVDAWRVRAALELAARGGAPLEAFDAVA